MSKDGVVWLNQNQLAELFATFKQIISYRVGILLKDNELDVNSVVKKFLTTASDGKPYEVTYYSLQMVLAIGYRVKGV